MTNPETGFCDLREYSAGVEKRVMPDQLTVGGLYVVILALKAEAPTAAAKFMAEIKDVDPLDERHYTLEFTVESGTPNKSKVSSVAAVMQDGILLNQTPTVILANNRGKKKQIPIASGYFKHSLGNGYDDGPDAKIAVQLPFEQTLGVPRQPLLV